MIKCARGSGSQGESTTAYDDVPRMKSMEKTKL